MTLPLIAAFCLVQATPNYGLTPAQMNRMSVSGFLTHAEKVRKTGMPEYELRDALYTYAKANDAHIDTLLKSHPPAKKAEFTALRKSLDGFLLSLHEYEYAVNGGGTMYLLFFANRHAEARQMVRELLENKLKDPGPRVTSDATKVIQRNFDALKPLKELESGGDIVKARQASLQMRTHYTAICESLKNRSRAHSNAVIDFCVRKMANPWDKQK